MKNFILKLPILLLTVIFFSNVQAEIISYKLMDHPDGAVHDPTYGLRLDELLDTSSNHDVFTFSFDHASSNMQLDYDTVSNEIHIFGNAYGGWDTGSSWDGTYQGLVSIDFTYRANVSADLVGPDLGYTVTGMDATNNGSISLLGWGGDGSYALVDEQGSHSYSFKFNNFSDSKGNSSIINDPDIYSGSGWLNHSGEPHVYSSDWLFTGHRVPEPASLALMGAGLFGLGGTSRLGKKR